MSQNAYRLAILKLIAQLKDKGQSDQYVLYQVMPDEVHDPTLLSQRAYGTRSHADVVMIAAGVNSIDDPLPETDLVLPLGSAVVVLKRMYKVMGNGQR